MGAARAAGLVGVVALAFSISGCATITREECRAEDWASIGQRDGAEGHAPSRLESHARTCANFSIVPDPVAYRAGWDEGVLIWCTPENGFRGGRANEGYHGLCPAAVAGPFLEGRSVGQRLGLAERRVASAEGRIRDFEQSREQFRQQMERIRSDRDLTADARRDKLDEIRDRLDDLRWDMDRAQSELRQARVELEPAQAAASAFFDRLGRR
ncbi:DUF2799 domain-containing protein [Salinarimonas sp. NSM]|uniref:DUF2799 domain-containing protein n=1 Tax=Salinarimonas sp. NSM TaxID=3458003 RepID=UPI00403594BC